MLGALIDNDVIIKTSAYGLGTALAETTTINAIPPAMLSVGRFVVRDRLSRAGRLQNGAAAVARFEELMPKMLLLEPTDDELQVAADLEAAATKLNLELDGGESQLLSILMARTASLLITGDKRAITSIGYLAASSVQGRLACFEQVIVTMVASAGAETVRTAVCSEPSADRALSLCFSCGNPTAPTAADMLSAMDSYIDHVRNGAAGVLFGSNNLSALAA